MSVAVMETASSGSLDPWTTVRYQPQLPQQYNPGIGLIGCGGITRHHLQAYRGAGFRIVAVCDIDRSRAEQRRAEYYPDARVYDSYQDLLRDDEIEVVDVATHTDERPPIIEAALNARRHVLSQKPFVTDLDLGYGLVDLADRRECELAVNQNGRWAPHFSYMRQVVASGLVGEVGGVNMSVHWNHGWVAGTPFDQIDHLILFDYAIHWFDILRCLMPGRNFERVFSATARSPSQTVKPRLLAQVSLDCGDGLAALIFHADTRCGGQDRTIVSGSSATLVSVGVNEKQQQVTVHLKGAALQPRLEGCWFPDGFAGTMGELLCAVEERRQSSINARDNLKSLELCFAAVASSETHVPVAPGSIKKL
jgi:predicted dehydrogenase